MLAAVSAPSSLAIDFADDTGLTLIGFLRGYNDEHLHPLDANRAAPPNCLSGQRRPGALAQRAPPSGRVSKLTDNAPCRAGGGAGTTRASYVTVLLPKPRDLGARVRRTGQGARCSAGCRCGPAPVWWLHDLRGNSPTPGETVKAPTARGTDSDCGAESSRLAPPARRCCSPRRASNRALERARRPCARHCPAGRATHAAGPRAQTLVGGDDVGASGG